MSAREEARGAVLGSIRRSLAASAPYDVVHAERHQPPVPSHGVALPVLEAKGGTAPPRSTATAADPLALFQVRLEAVGGTFTVARGATEVSAAIERILVAGGARRAAASDSPRVRPLVEAACAAARVELLLDAPHADLFDCDVGISGAQWGIAETGTLVLESARERHRFVSLIPRVHVALLRADRICDTLGEALRHVREGDRDAAVSSAAITFVTGPSRTSDIELTLAIGVHGPQELHVILMEAAGSPSDAPVSEGVQPSERG